MTRDTESGQLFHKKVPLRDQKKLAEKKNALDIHEFFVGGDKKGNLDLEIAHKNDIWLISESRSSLGSPVESERILKKFLPKMAMIWKHSIHPAL